MQGLEEKKELLLYIYLLVIKSIKINLKKYVKKS